MEKTKKNKTGNAFAAFEVLLGFVSTLCVGANYTDFVTDSCFIFVFHATIFNPNKYRPALEFNTLDFKFNTPAIPYYLTLSLRN